MNAASEPVRAILERYAAAVRAKDVDAFVALYDADVHVFDMWGQWSLRGIDAWREMARGWFGSLGEEHVVVGFDDVEAMAADGLAIGHATTTYTAYAADGTRLRSLDNRITLVLRRLGGDWKVAHQHTSTPIEHGSLKAMLQRPPA
jgi:uncharacterized protein (TIGR02246 family)